MTSRCFYITDVNSYPEDTSHMHGAVYWLQVDTQKMSFTSGNL